jgi:hypothetical protein
MLVERLLDEGHVDIVVSFGEDSSLLFGRDGQQVSLQRESLGSGLKALATHIRKVREMMKPNQKLCVFLDDFLGGTFPRPVGDGEDVRLVRLFLSGDRRSNPVLQALERAKATVIMSVRSVLLLLTRVTCGLPLYQSFEAPGAAINIIDFRGGGHHDVPRPGEGSFLRQVLARNLKYSERIRRKLAPPIMTAFAPGKASDFKTGDAEKVAKTVFQADLEAIAEFIRRLERNENLASPNARERQQLVSLRKAYLYSLAAGLTFPLPRPDKWPHHERLSREFRVALGLQPEQSGDLAYRVPNRFYLLAIRYHLSSCHNVDTASKAISHLMSWLQKDERVLARGVLEWVLENVSLARGSPKKQPSMALDYARECLRVIQSELLDPLYGKRGDPLMSWEMRLLAKSVKPNLRGNDTIFFRNLHGNAGLACAVAWGLHRFKSLISTNTHSGDKVIHSFRRYLKAELGQNKREGGNASRLSLISAAYSNMARWLVPYESVTAKGGHFAELAEICSYDKPVKRAVDSGKLQRELNMVFEDVLIWADTFQIQDGNRIKLQKLPAAKRFAEAMQNDAFHPDLDDWLRANRLFSVAWHNEWMERKGYLRALLRNWLSKQGQAIQEMVRNNPRILEWNLTYHWHHMLAQWSVWTRDWCFSLDPSKFETDRAPLGCERDVDNNALIGDLLQVVLTEGRTRSDAHLVRNAFFLAAMRCNRQALSYSQHLGLCLLSCMEAGDKGQVAEGLLCAVFELCRQGFLEKSASTPNPKSALRDRHVVPAPLVDDCKNFVKHFWTHIPKAFSGYRQELTNVTYLELLPNHIFQIMPSDWSREEFFAEELKKFYPIR